MTRIAALAIGSELLDGRVPDSNTAAIGAALRDAGLKLAQSRCVPDDPAQIAAQLQDLAAAHDVLLVSGGLGPTDDDLTASAAAFKLSLTENTRALALIEAFFARSGRPLHPGNLKQAQLPETATPLPNANGSAPGFLLEQHDCRFYFLPGVPHEMSAMLDDQVLPELRQHYPAPPRRRKTFKVLGIAESHLQHKLREVSLPEGVATSFTLDYPLVLLSFEAGGEHATRVLKDCAALVRPVLGEALVAEDHESLPQVVAAQLTERRKTVAIAESCTGGLVAKLLTDIPGASRFLERAAVTYADSAKQDWLEVPARLLEKHGAVSAEVAEAMAAGMRRAADSDFALALTGIAGPDGGTPDKPVGTVYVALATRDRSEATLLALKGSRAQIRLAAALRSLDLLRRRLRDPE